MSDAPKKLQVAIEATSNLAATASADKQALEGVAAATAATASADEKAGKATESLTHQKRELLESTHELIRQYPILREAIHAAFSPMVLSIGGIIEAVNIWMERMKTAQELLGGWELPDLTEHTANIGAAAEAYDKLKTAVQDANTEFNSGAGIFERQEKAIAAQLTATKQLIEAQRKQAEADLDLQKAKGQITPEQYAERKAALDRSAGDQTTGAELSAMQAQLAAKRDEIARLGREQTAQSAKAAGIQPGLSDDDLDDLIKKTQAAADEAGKKSAEFGAEAKHAQEVAERVQGGRGLEGLADDARNIGGDVAFFAKYGLTADPEEIAKLSQKQEKEAETTRRNLEKQASLLKKQKEERDKAAKEAAYLAGKQATAKDEFAGDSDPNIIGSTAWQMNQLAQRQAVQDKASQTKEDADTITRFREDAQKLESFDRNRLGFDPVQLTNAARTIEDMKIIMNNHTALLQGIAGLRPDLDALRRAQEIIMHQNQNAGPTNFSQ